ncbi:MAG: hypothetical protein KDC35_03650 [Acidobacteria bacterium]|nr:hypothetical protein [Acidobacteriota bacterium]
MAVSREALEETYRLISDDELLDRITSGTLTDVAQLVAEAERQKRGLQIEDTAEAPAEEEVDESAHIDLDQYAHLTSYRRSDTAYMVCQELERFELDVVVAEAESGALELRVIKSQLEEAQIKLAAIDTAQLESETVLDEGQCPRCGSDRSVPHEQGVLRSLFIAIGLANPTAYFCQQCEHSWQLE